MRQTLQVAKDDRRPVLLRQPIHLRMEQRLEVLSIGIVVPRDGGPDTSRFDPTPAGRFDLGPCGDSQGNAMQPTGK